jgi:signal recognition particle receptor subunit beta
MPVYDVAQDRLVLRIVYDGPGVGGKTTNIEWLRTGSGVASAGGFFDAGRVADRTQFFECMHMDAGLVEGHRMRTLFVTVPGQDELRTRRLALLDGADAVVFVCDSTIGGVARARAMYEDLCRHLAERGHASTPIVVQANKQDLPEALDSRQVARALGTEPTVPIVPARAVMGTGVWETALAAVRAAASDVRAVIARDGIESIAQDSGAPERLLESVRAVAGSDTPEDEPQVLHAIADLAPAPADAHEGRAAAPSHRAGPSLPSRELPESRAWPAGLGRDVLERLCSAGMPVLRSDLMTQAAGAVCVDQRIVFEVGAWHAETSALQRFTELEAAEGAMRTCVDRAQHLEKLLPPRTALFLTSAVDGAFWLWVVRPWFRTFEERLQRSRQSGNGARLETELRAYSAAALDALSLASEKGMPLDLAPAKVATLGQRVCYLGIGAGVLEQSAPSGDALCATLEAWGASIELLNECRGRVAHIGVKRA